MTHASTRQQIVDAADRLFYERGFGQTSFADIAAEVQISRGNFYHHFRSKDEILAAVIDARSAQTGEMLGTWETDGATPRERLRCFADMLVRNRGDIQRYGCPVGTLCAELSKLDHAGAGAATELFELFRAWLRTQFVELGAGRRADDHAMHLLAWSQGVASLAHAFRDERFIRREVDQIDAWIASVAADSDRGS